MPRVRRRGRVPAEPGQVWAVVSDPAARTRWWPGVERVEEASPEAWTEVLRSSKGKAIRADFTCTEVDPPRILAWRQEVEESPFERFMSEATTRLSLSPDEAGGTRVQLEASRKLRGLARLDSPLVRRATRRQLDEALAGLEDALDRAS